MKRFFLYIMLALLPLCYTYAEDFEESHPDEQVDPALQNVPKWGNVKEMKQYVPEFSSVKKMEKREEKKEESHFNASFLESLLPFFRPLGYILIAVVLVVVGVVLYRMYSEHKLSEGGIDFDEKVDVQHELSIFGHDFQKEIDEQVRQGNFKEAVRLLYLFVLYYLNEGKLLAWDECKTPTEYYDELKDKRYKSSFSVITIAFLKARFSNIEVNNDDYMQVKNLGMPIINSIRQQIVNK